MEQIQQPVKDRNDRSEYETLTNLIVCPLLTPNTVKIIDDTVSPLPKQQQKTSVNSESSAKPPAAATQDADGSAKKLFSQLRRQSSSSSSSSCSACAMTFSSEKLLERHYLSNHEFKCKFCDAKMDKDVYGDHLRAHLATERRKGGGGGGGAAGSNKHI